MELYENLQAMPGQHKVCMHGIQLRKCAVCDGGGSYLCVHGIQKHRCKKCPKTKYIGTSLCECGNVRHQCSKCRRKPEVKKLCKCGKRLTRCRKCKCGGGICSCGVVMLWWRSRHVVQELGTSMSLGDLRVGS